MRSPDARRRIAEIQEELRILRERSPAEYPRLGATLLDELKRLQKSRRRYAIM